MEQTGVPKVEKSLKDAATEAIKFLGIKDPDAQGVLNKWKAEEDRDILKLEGIEQIYAIINSQIYEAEIYFEAGEKERALDSLKEASREAMGWKMNDLLEKISEKMQEYSKS